MTAAEPPDLDPRIAELLSARLDGALGDEEQAVADAWLERSPAAHAQYHRLRAVKQAVADLPPVEPPPGFFETMLEHGSPRPAPRADTLRRLPHRPSRWGHSPAGLAASVLATAAVWLALAGVDADAVRPPLDGVQAAALNAPGLEPAPVAEVPVLRAGRLELVEAVAHGDEAMAVLGDRGGMRVAVYRQEGSVAWDDLPEGRRGGHDGMATWVDLSAAAGIARVVVVRDGAVYTLVSADVGPDALLDIGIDLPAGDDGADTGAWPDRARRACEALVDALSLD